MKSFLKYILLGIAILFLNPSIKAQVNGIDRFAEVVDSLHQNIVFPYSIAPGIILTNVGVDKNDKMLVINYLLNPEIVDAVVENAPTENGVAQLLSGYDEVFSTSMIEAESGYKIIINSPSSDGINKTKIITVPSTAIPVVYSKLKNGDFSPLKPYLEMLQSSISNMHFPFKIVAGIYCTDAYIKGKEAHWIYLIEGDSDELNFSEEIIQNNRLNLLNNLRANLSENYIEEIKEQGITLHYTYYNEKGEKLFEFVFGRDDLI